MTGRETLKMVQKYRAKGRQRSASEVAWQRRERKNLGTCMRETLQNVPRGDAAKTFNASRKRLKYFKMVRVKGLEPH